MELEDRCCMSASVPHSLRKICLMLMKLQYAMYLNFIGALNGVHSPVIFDNIIF